MEDAAALIRVARTSRSHVNESIRELYIQPEAHAPRRASVERRVGKREKENRRVTHTAPSDLSLVPASPCLLFADELGRSATSCGIAAARHCNEALVRWHIVLTRLAKYVSAHHTGLRYSRQVEWRTSHYNLLQTLPQC